MLPHMSIRINIKIRFIANNYNILTHTLKYNILEGISIAWNTSQSWPISFIKYSNAYSKIYIYHYLVAIDFIFFENL